MHRRNGWIEFIFALKYYTMFTNLRLLQKGCVTQFSLEQGREKSLEWYFEQSKYSNRESQLPFQINTKRLKSRNNIHP